jgi:FkbM family methyltransferase
MTQQTAIYGAGGGGRIFLEGLRSEGVEIDFFIDQFTPLEEVEGCPVRRLDAVESPGDVAVYVTIGDNPACGTSVARDLKAAGFGVVHDYEAVLRSSRAVLRGYADRSLLWFRPTAAEMVDPDGIRSVRGLLSDDASRDLLDRLVRFRTTLDPSDYVVSDGQTEYFPADVPVGRADVPLRFADCGAYRGETAEAALRHWPGKVEMIAAFEPDPANVHPLSRTLQACRAQAPDTAFVLLPLATWSDAEVLQFQARGSDGSCVISGSEAASGAILVPATSLDLTLGATPPTMIKMDIEGSEGKALDGARAIIESERPTLAICVYHKPEDLWDLPLRIHDMRADYDMYLRVHSWACTSTVLYCVPKR